MKMRPYTWFNKDYHYTLLSHRYQRTKQVCMGYTTQN